MFFKKTPKKKIVFKYNNVIHLFVLGKTKNDKIAGPRQIILQHSAFSKAQLEHAQSSTGWRELYDDGRDKDVCIDCPLMGPVGQSRCYTHKPMQSLGFISSLRTMPLWENIEQYNENHHLELISMAKNKYVRFGTYGEPSLLPFALIAELCSVAESHTAYTHQWRKYPLLAPFFMASCETIQQAMQAKDLGWRSFVALPKKGDNAYDSAEFIHCPASKEKGYKTACSSCGLCNGASKKRSVVILDHYS